MYEVKYRISYFRKSGGQTTIDILDSAGSGSVTDLQPASNPLEINFDGDINNIYKPTKGSGATIKVMATPLTLVDLFTTDPQKFMVRIYDGESEDSSGADDLVWQGFVNTGIYTESYSTPICLQSEITIYCNDGMVLLEDIPYTATVGGAKYTGFATIGAVMKNIFDKLAIDLLRIRMATDLQYETYTNLFTALSVNNENYYDESEKNKPMSCREVLESIFGGLGLVLSLKGFVIYIIDPIQLHSNLFKIYDTHPIYGSNFSTTTVGDILDISTGDIAWFETGTTMDIISPFTSIDIPYDPYSFVGAGYDFNAEGNAGNIDSYSEITNNGVTYNWYIDVTMKDWILYGSTYFEGIKEVGTGNDSIDYFIRQTIGGTGSFVYTFPFSNIQQDEGLMLELSMDIYINTKHATNIISPAEAGQLYNTNYLTNIQIKIGDKWYNGAGLPEDAWHDIAYDSWMYIRELNAKITPARKQRHKTWFSFLWIGVTNYYAEVDESEINDKWVTSVLHIPLDRMHSLGVSLVNGSVSIIIPKALDTFQSTGVLNALIKNVNVQIVDKNKVPLLNDSVVVNAVIDGSSNIKEAKLNISLKNGTGPYGVSKAAFSSALHTLAGSNISGLSREDQVEYKTSDLLLQSLMGQYGSPRVILKGKLDVKNYLSDFHFYLIKDSTYLGTKRFYIVGGTYNDRNEYFDCDMIELTDTRETITT
jgi:hypothetical protein